MLFRNLEIKSVQRAGQVDLDEICWICLHRLCVMSGKVWLGQKSEMARSPVRTVKEEETAKDLFIVSDLWLLSFKWDAVNALS